MKHNRQYLPSSYGFLQSQWLNHWVCTPPYVSAASMLGIIAAWQLKGPSNLLTIQHFSWNKAFAGVEVSVALIWQIFPPFHENRIIHVKPSVKPSCTPEISMCHESWAYKLCENGSKDWTTFHHAMLIINLYYMTICSWKHLSNCLSASSIKTFMRHYQVAIQIVGWEEG
jgi:hypothetical protein